MIEREKKSERNTETKRKSERVKKTERFSRYRLFLVFFSFFYSFHTHFGKMLSMQMMIFAFVCTIHFYISITLPPQAVWSPQHRYGSRVTIFCAHANCIWFEAFFKFPVAQTCKICLRAFVCGNLFSIYYYFLYILRVPRMQAVCGVAHSIG